MFKTLRILALAPILAVASLAYVSAPAAAADLPFYSSGLVDQNGNVDVGTGFTVQHTGAGTYVITYPTGTFTSFPLMTVTPFGFDGHSTTAIIAGETGANGGASFTIQLTDKVGKSKPVDNGCSFTLIAS